MNTSQAGEAMTAKQGRVAMTPELKRRRRLLTLWSLPVVVLAALFSAKTVSAALAADAAATHYAAGDYEAAADAARAQLFVNLFEPWKGHFNLGDAYVGMGVLDEAQAEFETALGLADGADECIVRVNLALLFELRGDTAAEAGGVEQAREEYDAALGVIKAADEGCFPPPEESEDKSEKNEQEKDEKDGKKSDAEKVGEELAETGERVEQKKGELGEGEAEGEPSPGEAEPQDSPSDSQVGQLEQELRDSNKERSDSGTADRSMSSDGEYVDKPW